MVDFSNYNKFFVSVIDTKCYRHYIRPNIIHHISEDIVGDNYTIYLDDNTQIQVSKSELDKLLE